MSPACAPASGSPYLPTYMCTCSLAIARVSPDSLTRTLPSACRWTPRNPVLHITTPISSRYQLPAL